MKSPIVVGVDPGGKGAFALYRPGQAQELMLWDMPTHEVQKSRNTFKTEVHLKAIVDLANMLVGVFGVERVVIEKVGGMPGQGSGFAFGWNAGVVHMAFVAAGIEPDTVTPAMWKAQSQVPKDKKEAVKCADLTFPGYTREFRVPHKSQAGKLVVRPDRAEAALIAHWGVNFK